MTLSYESKLDRLDKEKLDGKDVDKQIDSLCKEEMASMIFQWNESMDEADRLYKSAFRDKDWDLEGKNSPMQMTYRKLKQLKRDMNEVKSDIRLEPREKVSKLKNLESELMRLSKFLEDRSFETKMMRRWSR